MTSIYGYTILSARFPCWHLVCVIEREASDKRNDILDGALNVGMHRTWTITVCFEEIINISNSLLKRSEVQKW